MGNITVCGDMPEHLRKRLQNFVDKDANDMKSDAYHSIASEADSIIFNCVIMNENKIPKLRNSIKVSTPAMLNFMAYLALLPSVADESDIPTINKIIDEINSGVKTDMAGLSYILEFNERVGITEQFYRNIIQYMSRIH